MYSDTMKASVGSRNRNKYAQVLLHEKRLDPGNPDAKQIGCSQNLSLLFSRHGVPKILIVDGAKEQVQGKFEWKARQADCRLK